MKETILLRLKCHNDNKAPISLNINCFSKHLAIYVHRWLYGYSDIINSNPTETPPENLAHWILSEQKEKDNVNSTFLMWESLEQQDVSIGNLMT